MGVGLLALLDDVATMAKMAATSLDDVAAQATKAGTKAAAVVVDDAAVTPSYVVGFSPERELPIVWKIAKASLRNKIFFLMPIAIVLGYFLPFIVTPVLMLGGAYLCYEGAEKIYEKLFHDEHQAVEEFKSVEFRTPENLEQITVSGAVRTDLILSAEIMAISLENVKTSPLLTQIIVLIFIAISLTALVYGVVALIVKMDDIGLSLSRNQLRTPFGQRTNNAIGRYLVLGMPLVLALLTVVGTAAMTWVGGGIIVHGLHSLGWHLPEDIVHHVGVLVSENTPAMFMDILEWIARTLIYSIQGVLLGSIILMSKNSIVSLLR